jgi:hypothetical protein
MSGCVDLIGRPYRLGADGSDAAIDCIHMVYVVLTDIGIPTPPFNQDWYNASWQAIARDLLSWGKRVPKAVYDGDVILLKQDRKAFAVVWSQGILYINQQTQRVDWCATKRVQNYYAFRYSRLSET